MTSKPPCANDGTGRFCVRERKIANAYSTLSQRLEGFHTPSL